MKKKAFAILTLCISLFAAVALVGCGGSGGATGSRGGGGAEKPAVDMRTDFIWFKVEVPEGVEITDVAGDTADRAQFKFTESEHASDRFIPVFDSDKNADELFDYEAKWKANSGWTEGDSVKYNGKTWRSAYFTHSGGVTTEYFTDVDGGQCVCAYRQRRGAQGRRRDHDEVSGICRRHRRGQDRGHGRQARRYRDQALSDWRVQRKTRSQCKQATVPQCFVPREGR